MKKTILFIAASILLSIGLKAQTCNMNFVLSNLSVVNGARFISDGDGGQKLVITCHITSKITECPYAGKFQQVDYNVDLDLPQNMLPAKLDSLLPIIAQEWVSEHYPNN